MRVIGLTGGIGTGKSTVAGMLAGLGAVVIDADKVGHEVLEPHTAVWQQLVREFGPGILRPDGEIDRPKLAAIAFSNPDQRQRLNQITHPAIYRRVQARLEDCRRRNLSLVILEVPLLIEADWLELVDEVWVTVAPRKTVLKRLKDRSGLSAEASLARITSQLPQEELINRADVVIDTDCSLEELKERVKKLLEEFRGRPEPVV